MSNVRAFVHSVQRRIPERVDMVFRFILPTAVASVMWLAVMESVGLKAWESDQMALATLAVMVLPAISAAWVYSHAPERTVDRFHGLGKLFGMYLAINLTLSAGYFVFTQYSTVWSVSDIGGYMLLFVISSLFLPGPYIGAWVGSRWNHSPTDVDRAVPSTNESSYQTNCGSCGQGSSAAFPYCPYCQTPRGDL